MSKPASYLKLVSSPRDVLGARLIDSLLIVWFVTTPVASFYLRFPKDRSIITFDRAIFGLIGVYLVWRMRRGSTSISHDRSPFLLFSKFEIAWALLSITALLNALLRSHEVGYATKIAVDAFILPLICFHYTRNHLNVGGRTRTLVLGAVFLAFFLFITGGFEFFTGENTFPYQGSELIREGERRVNGPFAADSSYAIICLMLGLFLIIAPRIFRIRFDAAGQLVYALAAALGLSASVLALFRSVALALVLCVAILEFAFTRQALWEPGEGEGTIWRALKRFRLSFRLSALTRPAILLIGVITFILALGVGMSGPERIIRRLTDPRNAYGRLATWKAAAAVALDAPVFGIGLANYPDYFHQRYNWVGEEKDDFMDSKAADSPHSNPLWILSELGLVGFLLYVAATVYLVLLGYVTNSTTKNAMGRARSASYFATLLAYWIPGLTLSSGVYSDLNLYFFFILAILSPKSERPGLYD